MEVGEILLNSKSCVSMAEKVTWLDCVADRCGEPRARTAYDATNTSCCSLQLVVAPSRALGSSPDPGSRRCRWLGGECDHTAARHTLHDLLLPVLCCQRDTQSM